MVVTPSGIKVLFVLFLEILDHGLVTAIPDMVVLRFDLFSHVAIEHLYPVGHEFPLHLLLHFMI